MAKTIRRIFTMILAICICTCMIAPQALAAEVTKETTTEGGITTTVTTTTETVVDGDTTTITVTVEKEKSGEDENGVIISGEETKVNTEITKTNEDGTVVTTTETTDGWESTTETIPVGSITVEIPKTDIDDPNTEEDETTNTVVSGSPAGTSSVTGDVPEGEDDTEYDYTESTVVQQGSVTVTTKDVTLSETLDTENTDLDYVHGETGATADNDTFFSPEVGPVYPTGEDDMPEVAEGYQYVFLGQANNSQFYAALLYTTPASEGELPAYTAPDGTKYYTRRGAGGYLGGKYEVQGYYKDGELVSDDTFGTIWSNISQYVMIDSATGELITTYCADIDTFTQDYYSYNIANIEDGTYYSKEQAAMIRTVAKLGYWGVVDDPSTPEHEYGSLAAMQAMMREATDENGNRIFTDEEIDSLTDGVAMTATQYSIWTFSNHMDGIEFLNAHWISKDANNNGKGWSYSHLKDIPADKRDSLDLLFKIYNYLITSDPTELEGTTADTIINGDNFIGDTSITVIGKDESHENNNDDDDTNDAYVTNLTFALVVKPSEENGDELVVTVVGPDGSALAVGRIAGEAKEGEIELEPDENGNYCFEGLTFIEGEQSIKLNLSGVQNLTEGVYLYTSEVRTDDTGAEVPSQTMVGVASGKRGVDVSMEISFDVSVDDEIIVTERVWHNENDPTVETHPNPPAPPVVPPYIPEEEPPTATIELDGEVILDEEVPLADVPATGDASAIWLVLSAAIVIGLALVNLSNKKRYEA